MNAALARAALGLVGTPFRLHGRNPSFGLDCVGLVAEAMRRAGYDARAPHGYPLRAAQIAHLLPFADINGFCAATCDPDIVLAMVNPVQPHLLVTVPGGFVHAHAGLGRVTMLSGTLAWPVTRQWSLPDPPTADLQRN